MADIKPVSDRSQKDLVAVRAVLAAVAEKPLKNRLEGLNVPLVAQAAQVASAQPKRVRSTLLWRAGFRKKRVQPHLVS